MALSKDDLLKPRYKVIADWPGVAGKVNVGDIFTPDPEDEGMFWIDGEPFQEDKLLDYPHLFRKLEWWEERKPEELIGGYAKSIKDGYVTKIYGPISKDKEWFVWDNLKNSVPFKLYEPATESEYAAYIQKQSK